MKTAPQKLSLNEFYLAAQGLDQGSDDFVQIFETAVRMYPADEAANLNAASAALSRGDTVSAEKFLASAGNSAAAVYTRGILAAMKADYATARTLLTAAQTLGYDASEALATLAKFE